MKTIAHIISKFFITYYKLRYGSRIKFGKNVIINHKFKIKGNGQLNIGHNTNLWAHAEKNQFNFYNPHAKITIGPNSRINGLSCHCQTSIKIGAECLIGSATIMDTDFHTFQDPAHILHKNPLSKPVEIGNKVWLGGQCAVLKGVKIGEKSVVGFRAVVTKQFPKNVVIAGNPAKIVKA